MRTITHEKDKSLLRYLKMGEDKTHEEIESAVNYFKLRKIKRMLLENQQDMEKTHTASEFETLHRTHEHLKGLEKEITQSRNSNSPVKFYISLVLINCLIFQSRYSIAYTEDQRPLLLNGTGNILLPVKHS
ncbi:MAG: hypothetical protein WDO19_21190 [Bacteroidota bacterium]